jgi:hypothetical protein
MRDLLDAERLGIMVLQARDERPQLIGNILFPGFDGLGERLSVDRNNL